MLVQLRRRERDPIRAPPRIRGVRCSQHRLRDHRVEPELGPAAADRGEHNAGDRPLDDAAAELEDAERTAAADGSTVEWSIAGITFAAISGGRAEFRLDPHGREGGVADAGHADSGRGADWVAFSPPELDQHAIDRATAWLASAWRRADGES